MYNEACGDYTADRYTQAEEKLRLVIKQQKYHPDACFLLGQCHWRQKECAKAIKFYDKALRQTPTNVEFIFHKGIAYEDIGKSTKAVRCYLRATPIDCGYSMAWRRLGKIFFASGGYGKAIGYLTSAAQANPLDREAFLLRGNAHSALGNLHPAMADYEMALQLDDHDADAWFNLAGVEMRIGNAYESMKSYSMAIELRPDDRDALLDRGIVLLALGLRKEALADIDRANSVDTAFAPSHWNRVLVLQEMGEYHSALESATKAARLSPKDAGNWGLVGNIHFKEQHHQPAVQAYTRCIRLDPAHAAEALLYRGEAYRVLGDRESACKDWKQILQIQIDRGCIAEMAEAWIGIHCR
jgi:tetratricopeptide (TPR) repeat protein